ncbi:MAG: alpha/beta hydrolase [Polyangiaceae bacterium]|nr:alpha/beta hydrolase [Polyangiaceae bacterium]
MSKSIPPPSVPPAAIAEPPFATSTFALAEDGTRLFVRSTAPDDTESVRSFFCDGIGCDGFIWKHAWDVIAPLMPMTHWHYRGHGRSAPPQVAENITIVDHAKDLQRVREGAGDPPCVIFGHSMGVQVALEAYRRNPEKIRALVLVCGSYGKVTQTVRGVPIVEMILPSLLRFVDKYPEIIRAVWTRVPHEMALRVAWKMGDLDPENGRIEDVLPYMTHMSSVDIGMFLRMLKAAGEHSAEDFLGDIRVPVLIVAAERDTFTPVWLSESMARRIPESDYLMVPAGSHAAPVEQPEIVNAAFVKFLKERVHVG